MSYWLKADEQFGDISDEAAGISRIQGVKDSTEWFKDLNPRILESFL
jgi:hypothetical protein